MTTQTLRQRRALARMHKPDPCPWWLIPLLCVCVGVVFAAVIGGAP